MNGKLKLPKENCLMVAIIGIVFTVLRTGPAAFIASGAMAGVDRASVAGMWGAALALASLCVLAAIGAIAIHRVRTSREHVARQRPGLGGPASAT
jgi:hypothetical protein